MTQESTFDERKVVHDLVEWVRFRYREGKSRHEVISQLEQSGYSTSFSNDLAAMADAQIAEQATVADRDPMGDFVVAAIATGIGGGITYLTFASASPGGSFFVFYGPAVFGAWRLVQGIAKFFWNSNADARRPETIAMGLIAVVVAAASVAALIYSASNSQGADSTSTGTGSASAPRNTTYERPIEPTGLHESLNLKTGDCFLDPGTSEFTKLDLVPCGTTNASRVTNTFNISILSTNGVFPSSTAMDDLADSRCSPTATWYIGPTRESWAGGDTLIACVSD